MKDQVDAEKARLELRKIKREHSSLDATEEESRRRAEEKAAEKAQSLLDAEADERIRAGKKEIADLRRDTIQDIKSRVLRAGPSVAEEFRAAALRSVEHALADLDVLGIPDEELVLIASAARDRAYKPYFQIQEEKREAEKQKSNAWYLRLYGLRYAKDKINSDFSDVAWDDTEGMAEKRRLLAAVDSDLEEDLESQLDGTETQKQVRNLVDDWLDDQ
jgi:hypothetical protein